MASDRFGRHNVVLGLAWLFLLNLGVCWLALPAHAAQETIRYFPDDAIWFQDIASAPLDPQSTEIISWLDSAGGWGNGNRLQIDFSMEVLTAEEHTPLLSFFPTEDHFLPDCDLEPVPVPAGGALEGEEGYACTSDGDCHLIVVHEARHRLYEMWRANIEGGTFYGGCLAVWNMAHTYGPSGRGEQCTSADAAGLPIAQLLFSADEVAAGGIHHAIRFILPNDRIRHRTYVHPATHSTPATGGAPQAPAYGARFRLRADFPVDSLPSIGAQVVARAMQRYGMILADAGQIALTAESDRFTNTKWNGLLGPHDLTAIEVTDFEVVDGGERLDWTGDCVRAPDPPRELRILRDRSN